MKREDWQRVYQPRGDALDIRVRNTLASLEEKPVRRFAPRRALALALAFALLLTSAVALAAGLIRSQRYDARLLAAKALNETYGFTHEMETFFKIDVVEENGASTVTYAPNEDVGDYASRLGTYTVVITGGQAEASWSFDGEDVPEGMDSPIWSTAQLAEGIERRRGGEEWFEITATAEPVADMLSEEEAIALAREAVAATYGEGALTDEYDDIHCDVYAWPVYDMQPRADVRFYRSAQDGWGSFRLTLDGATGELLSSSWYIAPEERTLPEGDLTGYDRAVKEFIRDGALELLDDAGRYALAQRIRAAGLEELLDEDYADPALALIGREQAAQTACAALSEKYCLTDVHRALFVEHIALVDEDGAAVFKLTLTPDLTGYDDSYKREVPDGDYSDVEKAYGKYADSMGVYEVAVDAATGGVTRVSWSLDGVETGDIAENAWGLSPAYDAACLTRLGELLEARKAIKQRYDEDYENWLWNYAPEDEAALDALMVAAGFSAVRYNHVMPAEGEWTQEQAIAAAKEALAADWNVNAADFEAARADGSVEAECTRQDGKTVWSVWIGHEGTYIVDVNAADGVIENVIYDSAVAGNG